MPSTLLSHHPSKFLARGVAGLVAMGLLVTSLVASTGLTQAEASEPSSGGSFQVGNYATGTATGGNFKRGYIFTVSSSTVVTGLSGAGTGSGTFIVGLYSASRAGGSFSNSTYDGGGVTPTALLAEITFSGAEADGSVVTKTLPSSVTLVPDQLYLLAQMRTLGSGSHATVTNLNLTNLVTHQRIATWGPRALTQNVDGVVLGGVYRWSSATNASSFLNQVNGDIDPNYPNLGLRFESEFDLPAVTTNPVSVSGSTITFSGDLTSTGEAGGVHPEVTLAFEWGTQANVGVTGTNSLATPSQTATGANPGLPVTFSFSRGGLVAGTTYYYRAVATNEAGQAAGEVLSFTFTPEPQVQQLVIESQGPSSATARANLVSLGTADVTEHGFCYATTSNPTTGDTCVLLGSASSTGVFSSVLTGLPSGNVLNVRAFATNSEGTSYSGQVQITAPLNDAVPTITGSPVATGTTLSAALGTWRDGGLQLGAPTYQWKRTLAGVTTDVASADSATFCVPNEPDFIGATLSVTVTQSNGVGATSATSVASSPVALGGSCTAPAPVQQSGPPATAASPAAPVVPPFAAPQPPRVLPLLIEPPAPVSGAVQRVNPSAPAPAQPTATLGGRPATIQTQVTGPNTVNLRAGALSLGVSVQQNQGAIRQGTAGATELEVSRGGSTTLLGAGLLPRSTVQVFLPFNGSDSREIARIPVSDAGTFSGDAIFGATPTERPLPIGRHVMQVVTVDENRQQVVVEMTINIAQPAPTPEVDRTQGVAPTLRAGQSIATNGGEPELVTVTPNSGEKSATVQGEGWSMAVRVEGEDGGVDSGANGGASVTFVRDQGALVSGDGFMPGTRADVWLFSDPTLLGSVQIDDTGAFNGEVLIDGNVITAGEHTLQLQGVGEDGFVRAANLGVSVEDAAGAVTTEEAAGFLWWLWLLVALGVVAAVVGGTAWYRRATR